MSLPARSSTTGGLTSAIAAACNTARSEVELYERCRLALTQALGVDAIWLTVSAPSGSSRVGPEHLDLAEAVELFRTRSGETELALHVLAPVPDGLRSAAMPICFGLGVALELRTVLLDRQAALDDASFQLRALRQVVRLLSSVHSTAESEHLTVDFMGEVFFASWAALYRVEESHYVPHRTRSQNDQVRFEPIGTQALDRALPAGAPVTAPGEVSLTALLPESTQMVVPLDAGGERLALVLLGPRINGKPYGRPERELCQTVALAAAITLKNAELVERLHSAATTDGLTGLLNRRATEERLEAELSRSSRHQVRTCIALIDLDRFKLINDTLGHAAGDRYLVHVGDLLRHHIRALDIAGRLGGDEFLVILPMTSTPEGRVFVERFRLALEAFNQAHPEFGHSTVSIGVAEAPRDGVTVATLLAAADAALYRAKGAGRNAVESASEG
jgi:diguanylate cyclase (GGDEF)-like protein